MLIDIKARVENIEVGDLVKVSGDDTHTYFVASNKQNFFLLDTKVFMTSTALYEDIQELVDKCNLKLIAKNRDLKLSLQMK